MTTIESKDYADLTDADRERVALWGQYSDEVLHFTNLDDAIKDVLEFTGQQNGTLTMKGHARMEVRWDAAQIIERVVEPVDEEYGNPDGPWEPTAAVREAATALAEALTRDYVPWACEPIIEVLVNVAEWLRGRGVR